MRSRDVIGKKIVNIRQRRIYSYGHVSMDVEAIILEDGTEIRPCAYETESDHCCDCVVVKKKSPSPSARNSADPHRS